MKQVASDGPPFASSSSMCIGFSISSLADYCAFLLSSCLFQLPSLVGRCPTRRSLMLYGLSLTAKENASCSSHRLSGRTLRSSASSPHTVSPPASSKPAPWSSSLRWHPPSSIRFPSAQQQRATVIYHYRCPAIMWS